MCNAPTISPYLRRPVRSYEEALRSAGKAHADKRSGERKPTRPDGAGGTERLANRSTDD